MTKGKLTIESNVSEQQVIEYCLNLKCSDYEYLFYLVISSFVHSWHQSKIEYYYKLIEAQN